MSNNLKIAPTKNDVGAYITGVDINNISTLFEIDQIRNILEVYGAIFFKKQNLNSETYQNFASAFGKLVAYPRLKGLNNFPFINEIIRRPEDKNLTFASSFFHNDGPYSGSNRPKYTMLMGIEIPEKQGNTIFSSGINAYEKLPENIKQKIKNATGIFSSEGPIAATRIEREKEMGIKSAKKMEAEHPIVQEVNGQKSLYISPGHLIKIKNIDEENDENLKKFLIDHVNKKEFIFSYEWDKGDVIMWHNFLVSHCASQIKNCKRVMHRITVK